jgi:hypothetical protein
VLVVEVLLERQCDTHGETSYQHELAAGDLRRRYVVIVQPPKGGPTRVAARAADSQSLGLRAG